MSELLIPGRVQTRRLIEETIKSYLATLEDYETWQDFFESSIGKTLLNILGGISELLMFKVETRSRESYLYTAKTKSAVYLLAQMVGYNPNRKHYASGKLRAVLPTASAFSFIIPAGFALTDTDYPLVVAENVQVNSGIMEVTDIPVYQGEWVELTYSRTLGNLSGKDWEVIYIDEENFQADQFEFYVFVDGVQMIVRDKLLYGSEDLVNYVDFSDSRTMGEKIEELYAKTVITRTDYRGGVMIMFGDGEYGKNVTSTSEVVVRYLRTQGFGISIPKGTDLGSYIIGGGTVEQNTAAVVNFYAQSIIQGGSNEDPIDKVKYLASRFFQAQARAVTKYDYEAVAMSYPGVISAKAERINDDCCTICISALKADLDNRQSIAWTETAIDEFLEYFDWYKMLSTKIDFWEPEQVYLNLAIRCVVKPGTDTTVIDDSIRSIIDTYCFQLGSYFRATKCINEIYMLDTSNIIRVYFSNVNGQECYPDMSLPCYGYFEPGSISISFQVDYSGVRR